MENPRKHGDPPYRIAVVHGGPGAAGEMAPVAREIAKYAGTIEPMQTVRTLGGQVGELARKLVLIGSGPFVVGYARAVNETRDERLTPGEREEISDLIKQIEDPRDPGREEAFARIGEIYSRADTYEAIPGPGDAEVDFRPDIYEAVWPQANELRRSGELLDIAGEIACPVVAMHGDCDPHPAEGVERPLAGWLRDFRFILLERCGHKPWIERHARDEFYSLLASELA